MANTIPTQTAYKLIFSSYPEIIGISDLCKMLNIGKTKAYQLVSEGTIKRIPCNREINIAKVTVIEYVLQNTQE